MAEEVEGDLAESPQVTANLFGLDACSHPHRVELTRDDLVKGSRDAIFELYLRAEYESIERERENLLPMMMRGRFKIKGLNPKP